jgi:hypothetical protein
MGHDCLTGPATTRSDLGFEWGRPAGEQIIRADLRVFKKAFRLDHESFLNVLSSLQHPHTRVRKERENLEWATCPCYSHRSAMIGSTFAARRAGIAQANPATKPRRIVPARRMTGSRGFPCIHFDMIWLRASERTTPAKIPAPMLPNADLNTIRNKSPRGAPSARRIPNSLVRCATV